MILAESVAGTSSRPAWGAGRHDRVLERDARAVADCGEPAEQPQVVSVRRSEARGDRPTRCRGSFPTGRRSSSAFGAAPTAGSTMIVSLTLATGERRELFPGAVLGMVGDDQLIVAEKRTPCSRFRSTRPALTARRRPAPIRHRHSQREPRHVLRGPAVHDRSQRHRRLHAVGEAVKPSRP